MDASEELLKMGMRIKEVHTEGEALGYKMRKAADSGTLEELRTLVQRWNGLNEELALIFIRYAELTGSE